VSRGVISRRYRVADADTAGSEVRTVDAEGQRFGTTLGAVADEGDEGREVDHAGIGIT
jgi:hypothetical protein